MTLLNHLWAERLPRLILLSAMLVWVTGFLLAGGFGLYVDDWTAIGGLVKYDLFGVDSPFDWFAIWPQGRPVGWFFLQVLGMPGRWTGDPMVHYLVGAAVVCAVAVATYLVVEWKFGATAGAISAVLFALSPLNTTHAHLTMVYLGYVGVLFALLGMLLYQRERRLWSCLLGAMCLLTYESTFLLFAVAPIFAYAIFTKDYWRAQIAHAAICLVLIAIYAFFRIRVFQVGLALHGTEPLHGLEYLWRLIESTLFYTAHGIKLTAYVWLRSLVDPSIGGLLIFVTCAAFLYVMGRRSTGFLKWSNRQRALDAAFCAIVVLAASIAITGFTAIYPGQPIGGRNTRIFVASFLYLGLAVTAFVALVGILVPQRHRRYAGALILTAILLPFSNHAYRVQADFSESWAIQKRTAISAIQLICDAEPGDVIALDLRHVKRTGTRAIEVHSFGYGTVLADTFEWGSTPIGNIPRIMAVNKPQWRKHAHLNEKGQLVFSRPVFNALPVLANRPIEPGQLIILQQGAVGLVRRPEPWLVDGVDVIKPAPKSTDCFTDGHRPTGPLAPFLFQP